MLVAGAVVVPLAPAVSEPVVSLAAEMAPCEELAAHQAFLVLVLSDAEVSALTQLVSMGWGATPSVQGQEQLVLAQELVLASAVVVVVVVEGVELEAALGAVLGLTVLA
eukprot:SAG31_NODE_169_length_21415_cov_29.765338_2_plen_109_part_00